MAERCEPISQRVWVGGEIYTKTKNIVAANFTWFSEARVIRHSVSCKIY